MRSIILKKWNCKIKEKGGVSGAGKRKRKGLTQKVEKRNEKQAEEMHHRDNEVTLLSQADACNSAIN